MTVLSLVWATIPENIRPGVFRQQVEQWADELGLSAKLFDRHGGPADFVHAARDTIVFYVDDEGTERRLRAQLRGDRQRDRLCEVTRDDGTKVAEARFYGAERAERKLVVRGTRRMVTQLRPHLPERDAEAAQAWLDMFTTEYERRRDGVDAELVRQLVRATMREAGLPLITRPSVYWTYNDELGAVMALREVLARIVVDAELSIVPVDPTTDYRIFAMSADRGLVERVELVLGEVRYWPTNKRPRPLEYMQRRWGILLEEVLSRTEVHERRLGFRLTQTHAALGHANRLIDTLTRTGSLPSVAGQ